VLRDDDGVARVIADRTDVSGLLDAAFHPIRQAGVDHPAILIRIADTLANIAAGVTLEEQRQALRFQLLRLSQTAVLGRIARGDRQDVARRIRAAREVLRFAAPDAAASN
jgi:uncharacterized membrane protein